MAYNLMKAEAKVATFNCPFHAANEGPVKIQYKCLDPIYVLPEMKMLFPK
jgi:hypothetical protein